MLNLTIETLQPTAPIRTYTAPRLVIYGNMIDMTAAGSGTRSEGAFGNAGLCWLSQSSDPTRQRC